MVACVAATAACGGAGLVDVEIRVCTMFNGTAVGRDVAPCVNICNADCDTTVGTGASNNNKGAAGGGTRNDLRLRVKSGRALGSTADD